jgi:hypothetical protein
MNGLMVVDASNRLIDKDYLEYLLERKAIVLISGSKFFRGPPSSGAVILPPSLMQRLLAASHTTPLPKGLNSFIGKSEIPRELVRWREEVADN